MSVPCRRQASSSVAPSGTVTSRPSMVSSTSRARRSTALIGLQSRHGTPPGLVDRRLDRVRRRSGRGRRSRRRASPGRSRAAAPGRRLGDAEWREPVERLLLPHGADPARHALAARLVAEERRDAAQERRRGRRCSSSTITTPEPSVAPAARGALERERRGPARPGRRTPPAAPPSSTARSSRPAAHAAGELDQLPAA